jgi:YVTN family beta-propeller protein
LKHLKIILLLALISACAVAQPLFAFKHPIILVTDRETNRVYFINPETNKSFGSIRTGTEPREIAVTPDGKTAYIANHNDHRNTIMVLDLVELVKVKDITPKPGAKPHGLKISTGGDRLYVTTEATRSVTEMSIPEGKVLRSFDLNEKLGRLLVLSPDNNKLYVAGQADGIVIYVDVKEGVRKGSTRCGEGSEGIGISRDGSEIWITNRRDGSITVIDTGKKQVKKEIECRGYPLRAEFTPDGKRVLVSCAELDLINVFDASSYEIIGQVKTELTPVGITITPDGKRAYITNFGGSSVTEIDLEELKEIISFPVGKKPYGIHYVSITQ